MKKLILLYEFTIYFYYRVILKKFKYLKLFIIFEQIIFYYKIILYQIFAFIVYSIEKDHDSRNIFIIVI